MLLFFIHNLLSVDPVWVASICRVHRYFYKIIKRFSTYIWFFFIYNFNILHIKIRFLTILQQIPVNTLELNSWSFDYVHRQVFFKESYDSILLLLVSTIHRVKRGCHLYLMGKTNFWNSKIFVLLVHFLMESWQPFSSCNFIKNCTLNTYIAYWWYWPFDR